MDAGCSFALGHVGGTGMTGKGSSVVRLSGATESLMPNRVAENPVRGKGKVVCVEGMAARDILSQGDCLPGKPRIRHQGRPIVGLEGIGSSVTDHQQLDSDYLGLLSLIARRITYLCWGMTWCESVLL